MADDYRVQLDAYHGPLDLLLYLIKREEVDIYDIPISRITSQYLEYVELLKQIDPNVVGEFLVMAATLMEIKSRMLLPTPPPEETDEDLLDPRLELVRQLLEYKKFKDAAYQLEEAAEERAQRFARSPTLVQSDEEPQVDLEEAQVWDLLRAFGKLLRQIGYTETKHEVIYDDTPIALHAADVLDRLSREGGSLRFELIFEGRGKGEIIGLFLALLELVRLKRIRVEQESNFGEILLHLLDATPIRENEIERPLLSEPSKEQRPHPEDSPESGPNPE